MAQDPLSRADAIVIGIDAGAAGALEASDLVHGGLASRVAIFEDPPDSVDEEFIRRGVPYEDKAAETRKLLGRLGVTTVDQIARPVSGTEAEGQLLPDWCESQGLQSVIVVTTTDHSRRVARVLRRAFRGRRTTVMVRPARFSHFRVDDWWASRTGARTGIVELQKLLLDFLRHPLS